MFHEQVGPQVGMVSLSLRYLALSQVVLFLWKRTRSELQVIQVLSSPNKSEEDGRGSTSIFLCSESFFVESWMH